MMHEGPYKCLDFIRRESKIPKNRAKYYMDIENAFLFAKLRQFKLLMKVCERV
jgi:hypothetical protein